MEIEFDDIIIPEDFLDSKPSKSKLSVKQKMFHEYNILKPICVNSDNVLVDGYMSYLILREDEYHGKLGVFLCDEVKPDEERMYIYGKHWKDEDAKEYVWYVAPKNWGVVKELKVGDKFIASTKNGYCPAYFTRYEISSVPPVDGKIRKANHFTNVK